MDKQKVTILYDAVEDQHQEEAKSRGEKLTPLVSEEIDPALQNAATPSPGLRRFPTRSPS